MSASISAESVELWSGSFFIGDGGDSTQRAARRRERADLFCFFHARFPQAHDLAVESEVFAVTGTNETTSVFRVQIDADGAILTRRTTP